MLVMYHMNIDLRNYLQQNHKDLTWKKRIKIVVDIVDALLRIHNEKAIHRDLHSGNILYLEDYDCWYISDLGFCGPADKPIKSIYGNLPYIAPEIIVGKEYTFASDIYSIAMLMWEISSGLPPFSSYENDYELVFKIINGMRPKIVKGTPLEYKSLMVQCWNADPLKRPDINTLYDVIIKLNKSILNEPNDNKKSKDVQYLTVPSNLQPGSITSLKTSNDVTSRVFTSKVYQFENLPEPINVEEEQQEAFHSKPYDFEIRDSGVYDNNSSNQSKSITSNLKLKFSSNKNNENNVISSNQNRITSTNTQNSIIPSSSDQDGSTSNTQDSRIPSSSNQNRDTSNIQNNGTLSSNDQNKNTSRKQRVCLTSMTRIFDMIFRRKRNINNNGFNINPNDFDSN
ncbi:kinase-like domain-containing protein [Glomus cerebriforme]|uniref:Kinase-like domain-containing protein n=1 Tax=Glomus cerebriforme TaxID=658196 RepID=A0A397SJ05_9GLOM|nr:kinase-like domain-containing protein [Glomus cerebriforme]